MNPKEMMKRLAEAFVGAGLFAVAAGSAFAEPSIAVEFARRSGDAAARAVEPVVFHIAVDGDDANDGSAERPLATLKRAVELTRLVEKDTERRIVFHDGYYTFTNRVSLNSSDWDLVITAEHKGGAILSGGMPATGETTNDAPSSLTCLIYANRTRDLVVSNLVFEGCSRDPNFSNGYTMPHSAPLSLYYTVDTVVDNVEVRDCAYVGIGLTKPTRAIIRNSHLHDTGAGAIRFYDGGGTVENCVIHDYGLTSDGAAGVYTQANNTRIVGNLIYNGARSAVTMWGDNLYLASNEFHHVMQKSSDGGALYGAYNDSLICDNYVHDVKGYMDIGLYCDEGGQRNLFTRNRTENVPWPIHMHATQFCTVSNNAFKCNQQMTFSFQGSGHGVFCDNKVYQPKNSWSSTYYGNCDFWGRNEMFVLQDDGSYVSQGLVDAARPRPTAGVMPAKDITALVDDDGNRLVPIDGNGNVALNFGRNWSEASKWTLQVGEDGYYRKGVPYGIFYAAYDETYVYFAVRLFYNALKSYTGCKNVKNGGWRHCDALRIVLGGDRRALILYPNGFGCEADAALGIAANDYGYCTVSGAPTYVLRIRRDRIPFAEGQVPFNAMMWNEDLRELKMLYPAQDENDPSGTLTLGE